MEGSRESEIEQEDIEHEGINVDKEEESSNENETIGLETIIETDDPSPPRTDALKLEWKSYQEDVLNYSRDMVDSYK